LPSATALTHALKRESAVIVYATTGAWPSYPPAIFPMTSKAVMTGRSRILSGSISSGVVDISGKRYKIHPKVLFLHRKKKISENYVREFK
jgi:hypothetical protein